MARPRATSTAAIIDTAADLFLEHGFHNTSIEDVAEAAGISKPTVYKYVKSKQWLLDQIILRVIDDLTVVIRPWGTDDQPLDDQLDDYLDYHIDRATRLRVFYRILYSEETEMSLAVRRRWHTFATDVTQNFVELLDLYKARGRIPADVDTSAVANLVIPTLVSLHRWYQPSGHVSPEELRDLIRRLLGGVVRFEVERA